MRQTLGYIAVLVALVTVLQRKVGADPLERLSAQRVHQIAADTVQRHGFNVSPCTLTAIAFIESGDRFNIGAGVNPYATRAETHINDVSTGMMQTLLSTAKWLATDMGYDYHGAPTAQDLYDPMKSMYYGAAFLHWLSTWKGQARNERWIVQSYNGGAGADSGAVRNYYAKFAQVKNQLQMMGVC